MAYIVKLTKYNSDLEIFPYQYILLVQSNMSLSVLSQLKTKIQFIFGVCKENFKLQINHFRKLKRCTVATWYQDCNAYIIVKALMCWCDINRRRSP